MGFMDKIKEKANKAKEAAKLLKEENRNFGTTMKRINNNLTFYGNVNRGIGEGDFWEGSYVSIEREKGVIYGSSQDDYVFGSNDIAETEFVGVGEDVAMGNLKVSSLRLNVTFKDGKKAQMDIITEKYDAFKSKFSI